MAKTPKPDTEVVTPLASATSPMPEAMGSAQDTKPAAEEESRTVSNLLVRGPAKGRWRIGRHFGPEPVTIALDALTETEIEALRADPELIVGLVAAPY